MRTVKDMLGQELIVKENPERIVSLVPSQTELLYDLELGYRVVGITKFCVHPNEWRKTKSIIGGTKSVNIEKVLSLKPDLIIANKEENVKDQIEALKLEVPVWVSDINTFEDALHMIYAVGDLTGKNEKAIHITKDIRKEFDLISFEERVNVAYLIWRNPWMTVGSDTFIHHIMDKIGMNNVFYNHKRYPVISLEAIKKASPGYLLLSSEPYPFKEKHVEEIKKELPGIKLLLVDGEMFSWYGSRLQYATAYFNQLIKEMK